MAKADGSIGHRRLGLASTSGLGFAVLVAAVLAVIVHPVLALPVAGVALAALTYGRRSVFALTLAVGAGVLAAWLSSVTAYVVVVPLVGVDLGSSAFVVVAALYAAMLVVVGPVTAWLVRGRPPLETTIVVTVALSVGQVAALAMLAGGAGLSLQGLIADAVAGMAEQAGSLGPAGDAIVDSWPSALVALNGFAAVFTVAGAGVVGARFGVPTKRLPALREIDLDPRAAIVPIAAVGLLAAGRLSIDAAQTLEAVGRNLLIVARWMFFLQGLAVFAGLYERARMGRTARSLGYVLCGVTEALLPLVSLTGLADIWLNVRRLPRDGQASGSVEAPPDSD